MSKKKSILTWLDEQANNGNKLCIVWEGGGDSGWCYFEIDGTTVENEYTEALIGYMYDHLNYGSWAGEFNANGRAIYNPETKSFEGTDYYEEDGHDNMESEIKISIPKNLWFDTFHIEIECYYDETLSVATSFLVKNGFLTQQHEHFCRNLDEVLRNDFEALFNDYEDRNGVDEFRGCNDSWIINRSEFTEENDNLVFTIKNVQIQVAETSDRDIVLEITDEMAEDINHSLNAEDAN
jgi:hypothetical protein